MNRLTRRTIIKRGGIAGLAVAVLSLVGCSSMPAWLGGTDYLGEAAAAFTGGSVGLVGLTTLVKTGVLSKVTAQSWASNLNAVAAVFGTLHSDADAGTGLGQAAIDTALTAWNAFQSTAAPVVAPIPPAAMEEAKAYHRKAMLEHPRGVNWASVLSFVINNLSILTGAGGAIASLIGFLVTEVQGIAAGTTTVAQVDTAYNAWLVDLAAWNAAIA